jgi:hypothetical protein
MALRKGNQDLILRLEETLRLITGYRLQLNRKPHDPGYPEDDLKKH